MINVIRPEEALNLIMVEFYNTIRKDIEQNAVNEIKNNRDDAYFKVFDKSPYDTGLSYKETTVKSKVLGGLNNFSFLIEVEVGTPYASFFAMPNDNSNPNFKYGERNTALAMIDLFVKQHNL